MTIFTKIFLSAMLLASIGFVSCSKSGKDTVINIDDDDVEMKAAIAKARETLPRFWASFDHPASGEKNFSLKVKITGGKEAEHIWTDKVEKKDGKIFAAVDNTPELVHSVKQGDRIEIPEADISDWFYLRNGKMVGNYTIRVLFKHMRADEAAKYKAILAEP